MTKPGMPSSVLYAKRKNVIRYEGKKFRNIHIETEKHQT